MDIATNAIQPNKKVQVDVKTFNRNSDINALSHILMIIVESYSFYGMAGDDPVKQLLFVAIGTVLIISRSALIFASYYATATKNFRLANLADKLLLGSVFIFLISVVMIGSKHFDQEIEMQKRQSFPVLEAEKIYQQAVQNLQKIRSEISERGVSESDLSSAQSSLDALNQQKQQIKSELEAEYASELRQYQAKIDSFWAAQTNGIPNLKIMGTNCSPLLDANGKSYTSLAKSLCSQLRQLETQHPALENDPQLLSIQQQMLGTQPMVALHKQLQAAAAQVEQSNYDYQKAIASAPETAGSNMAGFEYLSALINLFIGGFSLSTAPKMIGITFFLVVGIMVFGTFYVVSQALQIARDGGIVRDEPEEKLGRESNLEKLVATVKSWRTNKPATISKTEAAPPAAPPAAQPATSPAPNKAQPQPQPIQPDPYPVVMPVMAYATETNGYGQQFQPTVNLGGYSFVPDEPVLPEKRDYQEHNVGFIAKYQSKYQSADTDTDDLDDLDDLLDGLSFGIDEDQSKKTKPEMAIVQSKVASTVVHLDGLSQSKQTGFGRADTGVTAPNNKRYLALIKAIKAKKIAPNMSQFRQFKFGDCVSMGYQVAKNYLVQMEKDGLLEPDGKGGYRLRVES